MISEKFKFKVASSIKIPEEFFNPLRTGIKEVDDIWSELGGVVPSQVTFITGEPGAGKTTLCLAISAALSSQVPVAFISLEMSDFQLANQSRKIPGFGGVYVTGNFDQEQTLEVIKQMKPGLVILDSIQKGARKMREEDTGKPMPYERAQFSIVEMFTKYAKETWTPVFLIGHCDKSGNYKGPSDLLHDVDSHLLVNWDQEMDLRTFKFGKNRFGGVMEESLFGINRDTVWLGSPFVTTVRKPVVHQSVPETFPPPSMIEPEEKELDEELEPVGTDLKANLKFCIDELQKEWNGSNARGVIKMLFEFLKQEDIDFDSNTILKDRNKARLKFAGNEVAECNCATGLMTVGKKTFTIMEVGRIGYKREQKWIRSRCVTQADMLIWTMTHEWMHYYNGMQEHTNEFFERVSKKYDWLIRKIEK